VLESHVRRSHEIDLPWPRELGHECLRDEDLHDAPPCSLDSAAQALDERPDCTWLTRLDHHVQPSVRGDGQTAHASGLRAPPTLPEKAGKPAIELAGTRQM
jgi:hypothetical protein